MFFSVGHIVIYLYLALCSDSFHSRNFCFEGIILYFQQNAEDACCMLAVD